MNRRKFLTGVAVAGKVIAEVIPLQTYEPEPLYFEHGNGTVTKYNLAPIKAEGITTNTITTSTRVDNKIYWLRDAPWDFHR